MDQPAWNYLSIKFPRNFFQNLPEHLFSNTEDVDRLDEDFNKYKIATAQEFITKISDSNTASFRTSRKEEVIEKLINYCINNSPSNRYKIQFLKIQKQSHRVIKIATAIFTSVIAPLLVHPIEFGIGSLIVIPRISFIYIFFGEFMGWTPVWSSIYRPITFLIFNLAKLIYVSILLFFFAT